MLLKSGTETINSDNENLFSDDSDNDFDLLPSMTSLKSLTNPYSQPFDLSNKVSCSLFKKATQGVDRNDKFDFVRGEKACLFYKDMKKANTKFNWGPVCNFVNDSSGNKQNLLLSWQDLKIDNLIDNAQATWGTDIQKKIDETSRTSFNFAFNLP